jgi:hypothetical protein
VGVRVDIGEYGHLSVVIEQKTFSAKNYRPNIWPKRIFGKVCRKRKKSHLAYLISEQNIFEKVKIRLVFLSMRLGMLDERERERERGLIGYV